MDASDSPTVTFECKSLSATANGTYQTPNVTRGDNWPICMKRTTTIKTRKKCFLMQYNRPLSFTGIG